MRRLLKNLTSKINDRIYSLVLYNRFVKRIIILFFKQHWFVSNSIYRKLYEKQINKKTNKYEKIPFRVMVENTNLCNADCVFCPHKKMKRNTGVMVMDLYKKIVNDCVKSKINYLTIYGFGEPLLDKNFIERVKLAKKAGIERVTTNTNAAFLTKEIAREIIKSGLDEIYISFDAATKKTYEKIRPGLQFDEVEKNIKTLIELKKKNNSTKPEVFLSFVENDINKDEVKLYEKKWKKLVDGVSFSLVHNWTGEVDFGQNEVSLKDPCRLLWTDMVISFNGDVPLCCNDYENKVILGNIKKNTIKQIWGGSKLKTIREKHLERKFGELSLCGHCQYNLHYKSPWWVGK